MVHFSRGFKFLCKIEHVYKTELQVVMLSPVCVLNVEYQSADVILQDHVSFFGYWIS